MGQPEMGTYIHGLFIEGARRDMGDGEDCITDSKPKELSPIMPMIHIKAVTKQVEAAVDKEKVYICPVYMTTIRGPTFIFSGPLNTKKDPKTWILAGVALVSQPD